MVQVSGQEATLKPASEGEGDAFLENGQERKG